MALSCARTLPVALGRRRRRPRFQMLDKAVLPTISAMRLVGVVDTHAPAESQREAERVGEVFRVCGCEPVRAGQPCRDRSAKAGNQARTTFLDVAARGAVVSQRAGGTTAMSGIDFYISNIEVVTLPAMRKELELFESGQLRSGKREVSGHGLIQRMTKSRDSDAPLLNINRSWRPCARGRFLSPDRT